jgi:hypothetical protein
VDAVEERVAAVLVDDAEEVNVVDVDRVIDISSLVATEGSIPTADESVLWRMRRCALHTRLRALRSIAAARVWSTGRATMVPSVPTVVADRRARVVVCISLMVLLMYVECAGRYSDCNVSGARGDGGQGAGFRRGFVLC